MSIEKIKKYCGKNTAILIYTPINRKYLTNFASSLGYLLITENDATLFVDGRYYISAVKECKNVNVKLFSDIKLEINGYLIQNNIKKLLLESEITVNNLKNIEKLFSGIDIKVDYDLSDMIKSLRAIKSKEEIDYIVMAQRIAEKAFEELLNDIKVGASEQELTAKLEYYMKLNGSSYPSFDTILISGDKTAMPHGVPSDKKIADGDFVLVDFGAVMGGYHSDMTRTVAVGYVTDKMQEVYNIVLKAQEEAIGMVEKNISVSEIDLAARNIIDNAGYGDYFNHSTGHSLGLEIHEEPSVSYKNDYKLLGGEIITVEPGIYIENEFGVRIEDMVYLSENGAENLTKCKKSLIIL